MLKIIVRDDKSLRPGPFVDCIEVRECLVIAHVDPEHTLMFCCADDVSARELAVAMEQTSPTIVTWHSPENRVVTGRIRRYVIHFGRMFACCLPRSWNLARRRSPTKEVAGEPGFVKRPPAGQ